MRTLLHYLVGLAVFLGVFVLNGLIYMTVIVRLKVSEATRKALAGIVLACIVAMVWAVGRRISRQRAAQRRASFLSGRLGLSSEDYLGQLGVQDERGRRVACAIRAAAASEYGVAPEMLHPSDELAALDDALTSSIALSFDAARNAIKAELGTEYDWWFEQGETMEGRGLLEVRTFGEFVQFYLRNLGRLAAPRQGAVPAMNKSPQ